jgi:hypothetical protein
MQLAHALFGVLGVAMTVAKQLGGVLEQLLLPGGDLVG